ncbi:MAG TPA: hypothetical protein VK960_10620 [Acidimicrobiia bacterium]|nr:hypothetical protein [Acidimicrobiia bacterium]
MDILGSGLRRMLGAIREQNIPLVFMGAALVAIGLARRLDPPGDELVYSKRLKPGESIRVVARRPSPDARNSD